MSAIAGIIQWNEACLDPEAGRGMMDALVKYPADDIQSWQNGSVFLGCHAQWITPESVNEELPYYDTAAKIAITADAILDNREELFEKLQVPRGLRGELPDSRLILLAYQRWGEDAPKHLIGEFAFVVWDEEKQQLFGARDFSGERTLYFTRSHNRFAFCTVMRPLLTLPWVSKEINELWMAEYLAIPGWHDVVDQTLTVYKDLEQLPPSHSFKVADGRLELTRYCMLSPQEPLRLSSNGEYEEAFRDVFRQAVRSKMRTRHKVGSQLSGGLDSGSVASFAARELKEENKTLQTFSYVPVKGFVDWTPKGRIPDETEYIQQTIDHMGNAKAHFLDFEGDSPFSVVDGWLETMEMPYKFFENSYWLKGIYEEAQKQGIGALLHGSRGNYTISWGPALDYQALLLRRLNLYRLLKEMYLFTVQVGANRKKVLKVVGKKAFPEFAGYLSKERPEPLTPLISKELCERTQVIPRLLEFGVDPLFDKQQDFYDARRDQFERLFYWNTNGTVGTKMSLRHSLWNRDPTNDLRVIRFCMSLPESQYVQNGYDRSLIRRATEGYLPDSIRLNLRKRGLQAADGMDRMRPVWKQFIAEVNTLCQSPEAHHYLNVAGIKEALSKVHDIPGPDYIFSMDCKLLMRSLIVYRFLKKYA